MYICVCKGITDTHIEQAVRNGVTHVRDLRSELGLGSCCGTCIGDAKNLLKESMISDATAKRLQGLVIAA